MKLHDRQSQFFPICGWINPYLFDVFKSPAGHFEAHESDMDDKGKVAINEKRIRHQSLVVQFVDDKPDLYPLSEFGQVLDS